MTQPSPATASALPDTAPAGVRARTRLKQWWWIVLALVVLITFTQLSSQPQHSRQAFHPRNFQGDGMMALHQILKKEGVEIRHLSKLTDLRAVLKNLSARGKKATVFVPESSFLTSEEWVFLAQAGVDVTIGGSSNAQISAFTSAIEIANTAGTDPLFAQCQEPDGAAASRISASAHGARPKRPDVQGCFPTADGYAYAVWNEAGTFRYLADPRILTNSNLAKHGNAALGLRALGHHRDLIWYLPVERHTGVERPYLGMFPMMPPWFGTALGMGLVALALLALAAGRRMGPIVQEPLPVVVKSGEVTGGRGRLYHKTRSITHAAAGLRAGTARRLARRLGYPRSAGPHEVVEAIAAATGHSRDAIGSLFYGPAPNSTTELVRLANELHSLEGEVHH